MITDEVLAIAAKAVPFTNRDAMRRILESAAAVIAADERRRRDQQWQAVLKDHHLVGFDGNPDTKQDSPRCACRAHLGWHAPIGAARQAWVDHVAAQLPQDEA